MRRGELKRLMFLKSAEEGRAITYEEIAASVGLHVNTVRKYMHDEATRPSVDVLQRLAGYFGVSVAYLVGEDGRENGEAEQGNKEATRVLQVAGSFDVARVLGG